MDVDEAVDFIRPTLESSTLWKTVVDNIFGQFGPVKEAFQTMWNDLEKPEATLEVCRQAGNILARIKASADNNSCYRRRRHLAPKP
jgi:hypothetical protein